MDAQKLLTRLFDYQRFEADPALQSVTDDTEKRYFSAELSDNDLGGLAAAGDPYTRLARPEKREKKP